jgi:hypothetical protein
MAGAEVEAAIGEQSAFSAGSMVVVSESVVKTKYRGNQIAPSPCSST